MLRAVIHRTEQQSSFLKHSVFFTSVPSDPLFINDTALERACQCCVCMCAEVDRPLYNISRCHVALDVLSREEGFRGVSEGCLIGPRGGSEGVPGGVPRGSRGAVLVFSAVVVIRACV